MFSTVYAQQLFSRNQIMSCPDYNVFFNERDEVIFTTAVGGGNRVLLDQNFSWPREVLDNR